MTERLIIINENHSTLFKKCTDGEPVYVLDGVCPTHGEARFFLTLPTVADNFIYVCGKCTKADPEDVSGSRLNSDRFPGGSDSNFLHSG